jgi:SdrD B-like domain/Domain of unknown function DUF11
VWTGSPSGSLTGNWNPWSDTIGSFQTVLTVNIAHPQPILSDIEFDANGSMLLGFMDRAGLQLGYVNYGPSGTTLYKGMTGGDILRACNAAGSYVLEGLAGCASNATGANNLGLNGGEYYPNDFFSGVSPATGIAYTHYEIALGGLAQHPGVNQIVTTVYDPDDFNSAGLAWYNNTTGANLGDLTLVANGDNATTGYFGKAGAMGDVELLCDAAPIEIGNRVWHDINANGVQDPGEPGLNGITVSRQGPTNTVTTVTSGDGNYYFNNLLPNTPYTLTLTPPSGYSLTQPNTQALAGAGVSSNHAISDTRDSDAVLVGETATIYYTTGSAGQNNHGLDFGFTQPASGRVGIVNTYTAAPITYALAKQRLTPDPVRVGEDITFTIRVTNTGSTPITVLPLRDLYDTAKLLYLSASILPGDATNDGQLDWSDLTGAGDLAPNASLALTTVFVARGDTTALPGGATLNRATVTISPTQSATATVRIEAPTAVDLAERQARYDLVSGVTLAWATSNEAEIVGFHLLRREIGGSGEWVRLTGELIPAQQAGQASGASYSFSDPAVEFGKSYLYLVEMVDTTGNASRHELGLVVAGSRVLLPMIAR